MEYRLVSVKKDDNYRELGFSWVVLENDKPLAHYRTNFKPSLFGKTWILKDQKLLNTIVKQAHLDSDCLVSDLQQLLKAFEKPILNFPEDFDENL